MPQSIAIPSFAKLNLALAVAPPESATTPDGRANARAGWHRICSLFSCIDLADQLVLTKRESGPSGFTVRWASDAPSVSPIDWPIEKDLIFKAHSMLESASGRTLPINAVLTKRIPVGGGMGGGSSNGAAMLRGLAELFDLDTALLAPIAAKLGSDVSFFLDLERDAQRPARPALVQGFGETLKRRAPFDSELVLICPPLACPTPAVYRAFDRLLIESPGFRFREIEARALFESRNPLPPRSLFNDLAEPAFAVAPLLRDVHAAASSVLSPVHVTGSGSTLFALVSPAQAPSVITALRAKLLSRATVVPVRLQ